MQNWILVISIFVGVAKGQSIIKKPTNATGIIGGTAEFECEVDFGEGIETIQWQFNNDIIYAYEKGQEIFPRGQIKYSIALNGKTFRLTVSDLELSNGGQYSCRLITVSATAQLTVLGTPQVFSATHNSMKGDTVQYICEAQFAGPSTADSFPQLQMFFDETPLSETVQVKELQGPNIHYQLRQVHNITLEVDMDGKYFACSIRTSVMSMNATTHVRVLYEVHGISYAPKNDQYEVGSVIDCTAKGNPEPEFLWKDEKNEGNTVTGKSLEVTKDMLGSNTWKCLAWNTISERQYNEEVVLVFSAVLPPADEAFLAESENDSWKIGVGVGIAVVICLLVIILLFLYCKKIRKSKSSPVYRRVKKLGEEDDPEKQIIDDGDVRNQENHSTKAVENRNMKIPVDQEPNIYEKIKNVEDDKNDQSPTYEENVPKQDTGKDDCIPKQDTEKDDVLKQDTGTNNDLPKEDTEIDDVPKQDVTKDDDMPKQDTEKDDVPKQDTEKYDVPKQASEKDDVPKQDTEKDDVPKLDTEKDNMILPDEKDNNQEDTGHDDSFPKNKNDATYSEAIPPDEVVTAHFLPPSMNIVPEQQVAYKSVHEEPGSRAPPPTTRRDSYKSYLPWKPERGSLQELAPLSITDQTDGQYLDKQEYPSPQSYGTDNNVPVSDPHHQEKYVPEGDENLQSKTSEPYYTPVGFHGRENQPQMSVNENAEDKPLSPQAIDVQAEPLIPEKHEQVKKTSEEKTKGSLNQAKKTSDEKPRGAPRPLNKALMPRGQDVQEKSPIPSKPKQENTNEGNVSESAVRQDPQGIAPKPVNQTAVRQDQQGMAPKPVNQTAVRQHANKIVPKPATPHQDKNGDSVTIDICNTEISKEKSFHGLLPEEEVQNILQQNGDYIITYQSSEQTGLVQYKLSFMWNQKIRHVPIAFKSGKWIFNDKHEFATARSFVTTLSIKQWDLSAGSLVSLKRPVARQEWELNADDIVWEDPSSGNFGKFINGKHLGKRVTVQVCDETVVNLSTFFRGGRLLKGYQHQNIAKFIGIAVTKQPVMMVMEYEAGGVLLNFLQNNREILQLPQCMKLCEDVLAGMTYLKEQNIIHRYIAAQNCLVGEDKTVKISNFSMARKIEEYQADQSEITPVKWTAPEALREGKYTHLSDVWSFGILMWEIFSFGEIPYEQITDQDLLERIGQGLRLPCPKGTPTEIYKFMKLCWADKPMDRPDIVTLTSKLKFVAKRLSFLK